MDIEVPKEECGGNQRTYEDKHLRQPKTEDSVGFWQVLNQNHLHLHKTSQCKKKALSKEVTEGTDSS